MSGTNCIDTNGDVLNTVVLPSQDSVALAPSEILSDATSQDCSRRELADLAAITELVTRIHSADDPEQGARVLATLLQAYLSCEQVVVGLANTKEVCRVAAFSDQHSVKGDSELVRSAQATLQEAITHRRLSIWPAKDDAGRSGLMTHKRFVELVGQSAVMSLPLIDEQRDEVCGAILLAGSTETIHSTLVFHFLDASRGPLASAICLLQRARRNRVVESVHGLFRYFRSRPGKTSLVFIAILSAMLLTPLPYRVKCDCELQPVTRRFVAMPFEGTLAKTLVDPGDIVTADQLLAKIDAREINWELAGAKAELDRARNERAGYVVAHESGKAKIAKLEVERLGQRTALLTHRSKNLDIRSPIDGIVVSGDLEDSEGIKLPVGQSLFEIAPLDEMVVEISVPEDDVRMVSPGMSVGIWFNSFPFRRWDATILNIHPRSELRDDENVFIATVRIENNESNLRPGMRGRAKIKTTSNPLGWNLFHKPMATALEWFGW